MDEHGESAFFDLTKLEGVEQTPRKPRVTLGNRPGKEGGWLPENEVEMEVGLNGQIVYKDAEVYCNAKGYGIGPGVIIYRDFAGAFRAWDPDGNPISIFYPDDLVFSGISEAGSPRFTLNKNTSFSSEERQKLKDKFIPPVLEVSLPFLYSSEQIDRFYQASMQLEQEGVDAPELLEKVGFPLVGLLSDMQELDLVDTRIKDLVTMSEGELDHLIGGHHMVLEWLKHVKLVQLYSVFARSESFVTEMAGREFIDGAILSVKKKLTEIILEAPKSKGNTFEFLKQMIEQVRLLYLTAEALSKSDEELTEQGANITYSPNKDPQDPTKVTSVSKTIHFPEGTEEWSGNQLIHFNIRPLQRAGSKDHGHASFRIRSTVKTGAGNKTTKFNLDRDPVAKEGVEGVAVDVKAFRKQLEEIGIDYHSTGLVPEVFDNEESFKEMMVYFAGLLGINRYLHENQLAWSE